MYNSINIINIGTGRILIVGFERASSLLHLFTLLIFRSRKDYIQYSDSTHKEDQEVTL